MTSPAQHTLKITNDTLRKVTVFNDRAELRREFTVELVEGPNEAISKHTNDDSIRVTGRGAAVIEEVQVAQRRVAKGSVDSERAAEIRKEKEELEVAREKVDTDSAIVQKQSTALDAMVGQIGAAPKDGITSLAVDAKTLENITSLFGFHRTQVAQLREEHRALRKEFDRLTSLITAKDVELKAITHGEMSKNVIILLEASEAGPVSLEVTYQVWKASWSPLYDIRVETKDSKTEMQLSYYANVQQSTGEEWEGAQLTLSTARPCIGGSLPELKTLDVSIYRPQQSLFNSMGPPAPSGGLFGTTRTTGVLFGAAAPASTTTSATTFSFGAAPGGGGDASPPPPPPPLVERHAVANEQTMSTEFAISRPCSIPADGALHKVTIGIIFLTPQLVHESVPSINASAFLTASALNSSQLPLLAGNASVYLDGAFVAKTAIKSVSPGERFTASLGVDPAVKIEYKPAHKYHEQTGLISKWSSTVREQKIVVKNTRADAILLTIREQIPRSTDEKIKVKIASPENVEKVTDVSEEQRHKVGARLLPSNNLEWTMKMDKGATQNLLVKYTLEHPSNEKLEYNVRFG
ncbi:hypothetical protein PRIPAC_72814 [Pristionchus pacificus]|uniref:Uncharacterized protein n=1 Tax=Pristionchus pacificus TaxID=54126 RepID=A0A2A6BZX4_PRIPA|nr:hypothetical protein PRIPAC_72814 [Pristionchus pacificus]|eukprot:PDM71448.1 hypothetical protein PRIPAC_37855 [Pristionchus pacificus]